MAVQEPIEYPVERLEDPRARRSRLGLAGLLLFSSLVHFVAPRLYVKLIPARLGSPRFWVYDSGVAEATSGALLLAPNPRTRRAGGWSAAATMIAVFPREHPDGRGCRCTEERSGRRRMGSVAPPDAIGGLGSAHRPSPARDGGAAGYMSRSRPPLGDAD